MLPGEWTPRERWMAGTIGLLIIVIAGLVIYVGWFEDGQKEDAPEYLPIAQSAEVKEKVDTPEVTEEKSTVVIDVKGAVKHPGVLQLENDARVEDAIAKAGGLSSGADISRINRAQPLTDGMVVYIPTEGEELPTSYSQQAGKEGSAEGDKVNLNRASADELERIPGIGPTKAAAIIAYRSEHGLFSTIDEIKEVSGIGEKTVEQIRPYITVP
ncbi:helix-hairpin-helix domain-containing protein [Mechercharimyces sp. CAU 1602]|uniref:helix-hairpin-helix domain-containing protein n=1 Tax=Mechercharimyces sp. CAU 1602 TaxID=2973933 RepID=UPI002163EE88|nr:helix-hairpin-helix domain-containing protein [Mechercharimyces sp. CAU 1602]MCS1350410.1 helix-hairpin-helix domain-containing protein [Mechercharimyces sp. CAU 1602]